MPAAVELRRSTLLRPAQGDGAKAPLTGFDRAAADGHIPVVFAWNAPAPTNDALKKSLASTLGRFPHLAGRFGIDDDGRKCFLLNGAGALVVEATVAANLSDALSHIHELYPKAYKERADEPIFQVQLTRYTCGGLVIGTACHHQVADGHSMNAFHNAWAAAVRSPPAVSDPDRAAAILPRSPPAPAFDHRNIEFNGDSRAYRVVPRDRIKNLAVHFPDDLVAGLKARVGARCSTFQCVLAHAWKKLTAARGLAPEEFTQARIAVDCRGRAKPPVPDHMFGNMVLWAFPRMKVRDLLSSSYAAVVGAIRDAVARVDGEYIQSFVDFGELDLDLPSTAATPGMVLSPDLEVDSWLGFNFHELDFGCGRPWFFRAPDFPIEGVVVLVPSSKPRGGVDLFLALEDDHIEAFNRICYIMD